MVVLDEVCVAGFRGLNNLRVRGLVHPFEARQRVTRVLERLVDVGAERGQMAHLSAFEHAPLVVQVEMDSRVGQGPADAGQPGRTRSVPTQEG